MVGVIEAISMLGADVHGIKVFSIGTTDSRKCRRNALDNGGIFQWLRKKDVLEILMRGQSVGINGQLEHLIGKDRYFRIDPMVPDGIYSLDTLTPDQLLADAEDAALHFGPTFTQAFQDHIAGPYTPEHQPTCNGGE
jgi:hypothetical protein